MEVEVGSRFRGIKLTLLNEEFLDVVLWIKQEMLKASKPEVLISLMSLVFFNPRSASWNLSS